MSKMCPCSQLNFKLINKLLIYLLLLVRVIRSRSSAILFLFSKNHSIFKGLNNVMAFTKENCFFIEQLYCHKRFIVLVLSINKFSTAEFFLLAGKKYSAKFRIDIESWSLNVQMTVEKCKHEKDFVL